MHVNDYRYISEKSVPYYPYYQYVCTFDYYTVDCRLFKLFDAVLHQGLLERAFALAFCMYTAF